MDTANGTDTLQMNATLKEQIHRTSKTLMEVITHTVAFWVVFLKQLFLNTELEGIWKEAVMTIGMAGLRKIMKNHPESKCPSRDSNQTCPRYKPRPTLHLGLQHHAIP